MNEQSLIADETTCPECEGKAFKQCDKGLEVCETCLGVGSVKVGPTIPSTCAICSAPLKWSGIGRYYPCLQHPHARTVHYLQVPWPGYPAGWPLCRCGEPVMRGKATCGQYTCNTALGRGGGLSPRGRKP